MLLASPPCRVEVVDGPALDPRSWVVEDGLERPFRASILCRCPAAGFVASALVGRAACATIVVDEGVRRYPGVCVAAEVVVVDEGNALATVRVVIAPPLAVLALRTDFRVFQQQSEPAIAESLLATWGIPFDARLRRTYAARDLKLQYDESCLAYFSRILEDAGISYRVEEDRVVLDDTPAAREIVATIPFFDVLDTGVIGATRLEIARRLRSGRSTVSDHDFRLPAKSFLGTSKTDGNDVEQSLERHEHWPAAFLFETKQPTVRTPHADDRGAFRTVEAEAEALVQRRVLGLRADHEVVGFRTTRWTTAPAEVVRIEGHPDPRVGAVSWLVTDIRLVGSTDLDSHLSVRAVSAAKPYFPPPVTPRPRVAGTQVATVVGPRGEEIHTDEFGRVRVQFRWDRVGDYDEKSSAWVGVNQPWAGRGFGAINLPRVGMQVLVHFIMGDPDRPFITGRVHSATQPVPYKLPQSKTQSGWRSSSTGGGGGYNEIKLEDSSGKEAFGVHAQRDHSVGVEANYFTTILGNRSTLIGGVDTQTVKTGAFTRVGKDRLHVAKGPLTFTSHALIAQKSGKEFGFTAELGEVTFKGDSVVFDAKKDLAHFSKIIRLKSGGSSIELSPDGVKIQSPVVHINVYDVPPGVTAPDIPDSVPIELPLRREGTGNSGDLGGQRTIIVQRGPTVTTETVEGFKRTTTSPGVLPRPVKLPPRVRPDMPTSFDEPDGMIDELGRLSEAKAQRERLVGDASKGLVKPPLRPGFPARIDLPSAPGLGGGQNPIESIRDLAAKLEREDVGGAARALGSTPSRLEASIDAIVRSAPGGPSRSSQPFRAAAASLIRLAQGAGFPVPADVLAWLPENDEKSRPNEPGSGGGTKT